MALQTLNRALIYPGLLLHGGSAPALGNADTLDAAAEYFALVICAPRDMSISHVGMKCSAATGSPTAVISIQSVTMATGAPSGALWAANTSVTTATLTTNFQVHALTAPAIIAKGQIFAVVVTYNSGTSFIPGSCSVAGNQIHVPYRVTNISGSPAKSLSNGINIALGSSATSFYSCANMFAAASIATNAFNNTSSARRGVRFQLPFTCVVSGFRTVQANAAGDFNGVLYNDAGTELSSSSTLYEGDVQTASSGSVAEYYFDNTVTLNPATWYRLALEPTSATNINLYTASTPNAATADYMGAWPGGANWHYTTYVASAWTDTNTGVVPFMDLMISQLDDGVGGGSGGGGHIIGG